MIIWPLPPHDNLLRFVKLEVRGWKELTACLCLTMAPTPPVYMLEAMALVSSLLSHCALHFSFQYFLHRASKTVKTRASKTVKSLTAQMGEAKTKHHHLSL